MLTIDEIRRALSNVTEPFVDHAPTLLQQDGLVNAGSARWPAPRARRGAGR
jgi:hypothetical protein